MRITPSRTIARHVDRSRVDAPSAIFITPSGHPNVRLTHDPHGTYSDEQVGEVFGALGTFGAEIAKIVWPGHKGKIDGLCVVWLAGLKTKEVFDQGRIDTTDWLDYLDLTRKAGVALRGSLPKGALASGLDVATGLAACIAKIDGEYHQEPVTDPMKQAISSLPYPKMWGSLYKMGSVIAEGPQGA